MAQEEVKDFMERREALLDALAAGVSDRDRPYLDAELAEIAAALAVISPSPQPSGSNKA